jgi:hypothetical protein
MYVQLDFSGKIKNFQNPPSSNLQWIEYGAKAYRTQQVCYMRYAMLLQMHHFA